MKVTLLYDPLWEALDWAKKYCPSYITNSAAPVKPIFKPRDQMELTYVYIDYYFGSEKDAILFSLRWQ